MKSRRAHLASSNTALYCLRNASKKPVRSDSYSELRCRTGTFGAVCPQTEDQPVSSAEYQVVDEPQ